MACLFYVLAKRTHAPHLTECRIFALYCDNYEYTSAYGTINTLSGSVTASSAGYSCAVYNQSIIGEIVDLTVKSTSSSGGASGIYSTYSKNDYISIGSISGTTVEVSAYTYAYGIWNLTSSSSYSGVDGTSSSIGDIEADVSVASQTSYAIGISNTGESIGSVSGTITVNGYSAAYGINNYADMGDVNADIKASATKASGEAVGIYLGASSSIGTIGGSITVTGDWSYGVYINNTNTLTFEDGASITSTNSYDDAYSIYSTASSLTLESAGTVTLTGDIEVDEGNGSLTITSGNFVLESEAGSLSTIAASSVTIGESASLSLTIYADDVFSSESFSLTNEGTLNLSAGIGLETGSIYAISNNTSLDFNDLGDVVAYGGTIDGNNFIIGKTEYIELDNSDSTGVQLTEDNSRIEVSSSSDSAASEEEVTTIVMNFSTTGIDDEDNDKVITVSAVSTVTNLENITLTIDNGGDSTVTTVNALDSTFAEFINETMDEDLTLAAAEAYYFAVDGLTVGDSVQLIFDVGEGFDTDLITVYYLSEGAESWDDAKEITDFTYEGQYLYVYAEGFSTYGYSIAKSATVVVPEPSTATLSLLALAGLLARRRRKA